MIFKRRLQQCQPGRNGNITECLKIWGLNKLGDFYNNKINAYALIDKLINEETPIEIIYFKVETIYGFGQRFVDKRIKTLEDLKKVIPMKKTKR